MNIIMFRDCIILFLVAVGLVFFILPTDQTIVEGDLLIFFPSLYQLPWEGMWTPELSGGTPRFVNPQLGILYPIAWVLALGFHTFLPVYFVIHVLIAGLGIRGWLKHLKVSYPLAGMLLYSCSGVMWGLITKPDKLSGFAYIPWFILGIQLLLSREARMKGWLMAIGAYCLSWFGGSVEGCVIMALWGIGMAVFHKEKRKSLLWVFAVGVSSVLLIAFQFIPLFLHLPFTTRGTGMGVATDLSMAWVDIFRLFIPDDHLSPIADIREREHYLPSIYIGVVGSSMVFLGGLRNSSRFMWGMSFLFFVLALGAHTPFYELISYVPLLKTIQYPEKYWMGLMPIVAYWGACGFQNVRWRTGLVFLLGLEFVVSSWYTFAIHDPAEVYAEPEIAQRILSHKKHPKEIPLFWDDTLHKTQKPMMMSGIPLYTTIHDSLYPNVGVEHGIGYVLGSDRLRIARHGLCVASAIDAQTTLRYRLLKRMGATAFFTWRNEDTQSLKEETELSYVGKGLFLEENPTALVFWTGSTLMAESMPPILSLMASPTQAAMVLTSDPNAETISKLDDNAPPERFGCSIEPKKPYYACSWEAKEDGVIVLRQNWLPGWKAILDGSEHPIARVNAYMIGIQAPKGEHTLVLEYRTPGLWFGGFLSFLGLLGVGMVAYRLSTDTAKREEDHLESSVYRSELETQA